MDFSAAIFYSFIFSLFMNLLMRGITATEREEIEKEEQNNMFMDSPKFSVSKEAAPIFKIISAIISFTPLLSSIIIGFIYTPKLFNGLLFLVIVIPCALLLPIFSIRSIRNYDFLFYVTSNSKAFFLFTIPFIPTIIALNAFINTAKEFAKATEITNAGIEIKLVTYSVYLIMAIMSIFLLLKRKHLNAKQTV